MLIRALLLLLVLASGGLAHAAGSVEAARAQANAERERINGLRGQQLSLRRELGDLATRIEALKVQGGRGELDAALKRSQELSSSLTGLAQSLSAAETGAESANLTLLGVLTEEISRVRQALEQSPDRERRKAMISELKRLRAERDSVRVRVPAAKVPALSLDDSDDPEDLLEQVDALRDSEDKLRQRLTSLRARKQALHQESELDARMNEFLGDDGLFDEQDRRLRLRRDVRTEIATTQTAPPAADPATVPDTEAIAPHAGSQSDPAPTFSAPSDRGAGAEVSPPPQPPSTSVQVQTHRATDNLPNIGRVQSRQLAGGSLVDMDLGELAAEEQRLERLMKELDGRAKALEQRAKQLD